MTITVGDTVPVPCPCCSKPLYKQVLVAANPDVWARSVDSPSIKEDANGNFMTCLHCKRRIAFERSASPTGWGFRILAKQNCG